MKPLFLTSFLTSFILLAQAVPGHANDNGSASVSKVAGIEQSVQEEDCPDPFIVQYRLKPPVVCGDEETVPGGEAEAYVLIDEQEVTEGYTFNWYIGTEVKEIPDFAGNTYKAMEAGAYLLEVIHDASGCSADPQQLTIEAEEYAFSVRAELLHANTVCEGGEYNGALKAVAEDSDGIEAEGDFTFTWFPAALAGDEEHIIGTGATVEGLAGGEYTVIMTDNMTACTSTFTVALPDEAEQPVLSIVSIEDVTQCDETAGGTIEVSLAEEGNYTIHWYTGNTVLEENRITGEEGVSLSGYPAGLYTAQAIDVSTNCISNAVIAEIKDVTEIPVVEISSTNITSCSAPDGTVSATVDGNNENIILEWYSGEQVEAANLIGTAENGETLSGLAAGSYTVIAIDQQSGCASAPETVILIEETSLPLVEIAGLQHVSNCDAPNGSAEVYVLAGDEEVTEGYTFNWYAGTEIKESPDYTGPSVTGLSEGTYSVEAIDEISGCASPLQHLTIEVLDYPYQVLAELVSANTGCEEDAYNGALKARVVSADGAEAEGDYTFEWYPAALAGESAHIIATGPTAEELGSGEYTVLMTDQTTACTSTFNIAVPDEAVQPVLSLQVKQEITQCDNPAAGEIQASLDVEGDYTIHWYRGEEITETNRIAEEAGMSLSGYAAGTYSAQAIHNTNLCASTIATAVIEDLTASPEVEATLTHNTACREDLADGSIILNISTPLPGADPEGGYQVEWFSGTGTDGTPLEASGINLEGLAAGNYTAVVTNPENGCSSQHIFTIEDELLMPELSLASAVANTVCDPSLASGGAYTGAISLELMLGGEAVTTPSDYTTSWYILEGDAETLLEENTSLSREGLSAGRYKIIAVSQESGCSTGELFVEIEDAVVTPEMEAVNVQPLTNCETPNGAIEILPEGDGEAEDYRIEWYQGEEVAAAHRLEDFSGQYLIAGLAAGAYTVQSTHTLTGCQSAPLTLMIKDATAAPAVTVESTPLTNCNPNRPDGAFSFNVDGETTGYSFVLYRGSEPTEAARVGEGPEIQGLREGQYLLVVTDETTSCVSSSLVNIETSVTFPEAPVTIGAESCEAAELTLRVEGEGTYYWYNQPTGGNAFHAGNSFFRNFDQTTTFYVTSVNEDGCESRERSPVSALIHQLDEPLIEADNNGLSTTGDDSFTYRWYLDGEPLDESSHTITAEASGTYEVEVTNEAGCIIRSAPYVFTVSGIIDQEYDAGINVYPNPFRNRLHISLASEAGATSIRVLDGQMRQLRNLSVTGREEPAVLDLSDLPQGMYYLEIREGEKVSYRRIARQ